MWANAGDDVTWYRVTDPGDDPVNPRTGTLRYGASLLRKNKVWITFQRDMVIKLHMPLLLKSFTTIDGRGATVHIAYGAGFLLYQVSDVIIHGLHFHDLQAHGPGSVIDSKGKLMAMGGSDGDAIRLVSSAKVWIDHNTLYRCHDGLLDVTRGSSWVTVSNNWFSDHNKVMLLGHDDGFVEDKRMKVTVVFNRFGPRANQRMPRVRHGYAHIVNNLYQSWGDYAIGGSMSPSIRSEANLFVAPMSGNKQITWREGQGGGQGNSWNWASVGDRFMNGAFFVQTGTPRNAPGYNSQQNFPICRVNAVRALTRQAGALRCSERSRC
ncbi:pectin lyase-like superfamily protein [Wolffia australiana]